MAQGSRRSIASGAGRARQAAARLANSLDATVLAGCGRACARWSSWTGRVALAAKAFVSIFPLLILVTALTPADVRGDVLDTLSSRFGLSGPALYSTRQAFATANETKPATGIIGGLVTLVFSVSFTTALQHFTCVRGAVHQAVALATRAEGAVDRRVHFITDHLDARPQRSPRPRGHRTELEHRLGRHDGAVVVDGSADVARRGPMAIPAAHGHFHRDRNVALHAGGVDLMPITATKQFAQFGTFGIALAFVTWDPGLAFLIILAAALAPALADGEDWVARWLRSGRPTALEDGAAPRRWLDRPGRSVCPTPSASNGAASPEVLIFALTSVVRQANPSQASTIDLDTEEVTPRVGGCDIGMFSSSAPLANSAGRRSPPSQRAAAAGHVGRGPSPTAQNGCSAATSARSRVTRRWAQPAVASG
jgi:hypothetical protein